jgi:hypothetical protein
MTSSFQVTGNGKQGTSMDAYAELFKAEVYGFCPALVLDSCSLSLAAGGSR